MTEHHRKRQRTHKEQQHAYSNRTQQSDRDRQQNASSSFSAPASAAHYFRWLIAPVSLDTFLSDYWEQQPLHVQRNDLDYYQNMLTKQQMDTYIEQHAKQLQYGQDLNICRCEQGRKINLNPLHTDEQEQQQEPQEEEQDEEEQEEEDDEEEGSPISSLYAPVSASVVRSLFASGATVQMLQPQRFSASVFRLINHLEEFFCGLVGANCYLTPDNSQGLAKHNDDVEVFACHLEGAKTWRLYAPLDPLAREHSRDYRAREVGKPTHVISMRPGDLLYMPRGWIHEADTYARKKQKTKEQHTSTSPGYSSHLTVSCYQHTSWYDFLRVGLNHALEQYWKHSLDIRKGLPIGYMRYIQHTSTQAANQHQSSSSSNDARNGNNTTATTAAMSDSLSNAFHARHEEMLRTLLSYMDVTQTTDILAQDFFRNRLPPMPSTPAGIAAGLLSQSSSCLPLVSLQSLPQDWFSRYLELPAEERYETGPTPLHADMEIRLLHPTYIRLSLTTSPPAHPTTKASSPPLSQDPTTTSYTTATLSYSLLNEPQHHMDAQHAARGWSQMSVSSHHADAILFLFQAYPEWTPVHRLGEQGLHIAVSLWSCTLIECRKNTTAASKTVHQGKNNNRSGRGTFF